MKTNMGLLGAAAAMLLGLAIAPSYANSPAKVPRHQTDSQTQTFVGVLQGPSENREWVDPVLYDQTRKINFYVDDWQAENYVGHEVKITGTLDQKNMIIHPRSIEELK
jgi:hypothetical protein